MQENKKNPVEILLVEDNPADIRLAREVLGVWRNRFNLNVAQTGDAALALLRREGVHAGKPKTSLVLLDLNLPGKSGLDVLAEIKSDKELKRIPVIILTNSFMQSDVDSAYESHANCYIVKPIDLAEFGKVARAIENFWLTVARLPEAC
jgi:CheY-like chemotaxis protein